MSSLGIDVKLYTKILIGMLIGVVLGLLIGPSSSLLPNDGVRLGADAEVECSRRRATGTGRGLRDARVKVHEESGADRNYPQPGHLLRLKSAGVKAADGASAGVPMEVGEDEVPNVLRYAPMGKPSSTGRSG